ncbi:MAG: porin [Aquabacterium sp.]|uniref:porin n=1 Tax=Aquabacterium sp. TaxID=1872578 RepID=UPI003BB125D9
MFSKKTAIAAAALLAAFAAQAQSQVSIYGNLDVSFGRFEEPGLADATTRVESGSLRDSFIGFKGQEDLGGGLKAFFVLESSINVDTGAATESSNFWGRTSVVGLSGDFGTVTLGNARSLLFLANDAFNPFRADSRLFSTSSLLMGTSVNGVTPGYSANWRNSITYTSPNLSGFTGSLQMGFSEIDGTDDNIGAALNYAAGPLAVNFTYQDVALNANDDVKTWVLGGSYDLGVAKLFGQYGQADQSNLSEKEKFFQLGVSIPVTAAGNILASYGEGKYDSSKAREVSLAYEHSLSKRTGAYIGVNNTRHNFVVAPADKSGTSFAVGVRHAF